MAKGKKRPKRVPRENERRKDEEKEGLDIDFGIGKLSLGGLFKGIEKLVDIAAQVKEAGGEISTEGGPASGWKKEGEIDLSHLKEGMKGVFGFSIKTAAGGKTVVEPFGNLKKTPKGPTVEEVREPITDVFDEKEEIVVMAEMPGIGEEDIKLDFPPQPEADAPRAQAAGSPSAKKVDILIISAQNQDRKYHKEVLLPSKVKPETMSSSYKNGILEVRMKK